MVHVQWQFERDGVRGFVYCLVECFLDLIRCYLDVGYVDGELGGVFYDSRDECWVEVFLVGWEVVG